MTCLSSGMKSICSEASASARPLGHVLISELSDNRRHKP